MNRPTLEARASNGDWRPVLTRFGYPAGMPRQMSVPLENLPKGARQLRLRTNQEIYWDRVAVVFAEPCPEAKKTVLPLSRAILEASGFAKRTTGPQRLPHYDDERRSPLWDTRHQTGLYTELGDVAPLLAETDDALVIFGPGEAVTLDFEASALTGLDPPQYFVLETAGWCKDMDLYTQNGKPSSHYPTRGNQRRRETGSIIASIHATDPGTDLLRRRRHVEIVMVDLAHERRDGSSRSRRLFPIIRAGSA